MKIIVVGGGKVGTALCRSLVEEKHDVILIEEKESVLKKLPNAMILWELLAMVPTLKFLNRPIFETVIFLSP